MNQGATTFLDGGGAPPGLLWIPYVQLLRFTKAMDKDGKTIPGDARLNSLAHLNQFFYLTPLKVAGANVAFNLIVPVSASSVKGSLGPVPLSAGMAGVGDPTLGAALQWNDAKIKGAPFFNRLELDVFAPWGKYDKNIVVNPGQNAATVQAYYAFTMFLSPRIETSWRLHYTVNGENPDTKMKGGRLFHANYAASYGVLPKLRLGAAGYIVRQLTDDRFDGAKLSGTKERAYALGPAVGYLGQGLMAFVTHQREFGVRNRFKGSQTTLQLIHHF